MIKPDNTMQAKCENCTKELFGRIDKRFCNDNCRNEFNRTKKKLSEQEDYNNLPEILKIIKLNHQVLMSYGKEPLNSIQISKLELLEKGFNFKYFTSAELYNNSMWKFVLGRGTLDLGHNTVYVKDDLNQLPNSR